MKFKPLQIAKILLLVYIAIFLTFGHFGRDRSSYHAWNDGIGNAFLKCGDISVHASLSQGYAVILWKDEYNIERRLAIFHENGTQLSPSKVQCRTLRFSGKGSFVDFVIIDAEGSIYGIDHICNKCTKKVYLNVKGEFEPIGEKRQIIDNSRPLFDIKIYK